MKGKTMRTDLMIIDPQVDFCDPNGSLFVPGATEDMQRIASMIDRYGSKINKIHVTLDCHHFYDIAHPKTWRNKKGENPEPFTIISHQDTLDDVWFPIFKSFPGYPDAKKYVREYTKKLEESGRYPLCIWNPHCLIGSHGNAVLPVLFKALKNWEEKNHNNVNYVSKGSNILTEHYSAIKAEVPDSNDPSTQLNVPFLQTLTESDQILSAGEAGSHCWKFTMEDILAEFSDDSFAKKMVIFGEK